MSCPDVVLRTAAAWITAAVLFAGCSAEAGGDQSRAPMPIDTNAFGNAVPSAPAAGGVGCALGQQLGCFCADGTQSGTQSCLAGGALGPCQGCQSSTGGAAAASGPTLVQDGALCPMLAGQSECTNQSFRSDELPASILFLIDRSGSMKCNPPELGQSSESCEASAQAQLPGQPAKWDITVSALQSVIAGLVDSGASAGLAYLSNDDVCGVHSRPSVPVEPVDATHAAALADSLAGTTPGGGTPIVGGTMLAYAHLYEEAGLDVSGGCAKPPCGAPGNRFVILITDGADSCPVEPYEGACGGLPCTDFLLDAGVHEAMGVNIRTFVIGAPGSEPARGFLSELARSGGTGRNAGACTGERTSATGDCHFDMSSSTDFAVDLSAALDAISGSAIGCQFPVPQPLDRALTDNVNVQVRPGGTGAPVCLGYDPVPCDAGATGWQFGKDAVGADDLTRVVLCGDACRMVQSDPAVQVDVVLGCRPLVVE